MPLPPYIARGARRTPPTARTTRRSSPRARARWRRRPRRCTSTRRCSRRWRRAGVGRDPPDAARRRRAPSCRSRSRRSRRTGCTPSGARSAPAAAEAIAATLRRGRAGDPGRHHGAAAARDRGDRAAAGIAPWRGETDIFIRPGYAFRIARRADDQLPPAEVDAADAGLGADGGRAHPGDLCPRHRRALPLLLLRRRLAAAAGYLAADGGRGRDARRTRCSTS